MVAKWSPRQNIPFPLHGILGIVIIDCKIEFSEKKKIKTIKLTIRVLGN